MAVPQAASSHEARWFLRTAVVAIAFPFFAATAGWVLTEIGRQPWIVQGLLKTSRRHSPNISTATVAVSLGVFVAALRRRSGSSTSS